jgi:hypothetical protein
MRASIRWVCATSLLTALLASACGDSGNGSAGSGGGAGPQGTGGAGAGLTGGRPSAGGGPGTGGRPGAGESASAGGTPGSCTPDYACKPTSPDTGDPYADCVARVNQFRACVCLPPLPRWTAGESCANRDAEYDAQQNTAHAGFSARLCGSGNAQDECPNWGGSYASVIDRCLQSMFDEGPPPTATCTGSCYQSHGHYINMTGTKYRSGVACGFYTTSGGKIWAVQNFQ